MMHKNPKRFAYIVLFIVALTIAWLKWQSRSEKLKVIEVWRTNGYGPVYCSTSANDGSCWLFDSYNDRIMRISTNGKELVKKRSPRWINICADPRDDSCWFADGRTVAHLSGNGKILWRKAVGKGPYEISINPRDGTIWIADFQGPDYFGQIIHLSARGEEIWKGRPWRIQANPSPSDDTPAIQKSMQGLCSVSVNSQDGSCGMADSHGVVAHISAKGKLLWSSDDFEYPTLVRVNPLDGSCFVMDLKGERIIHLAANGKRLWEERIEYSDSISVSPKDRSVWVLDQRRGEIIHFSSTGRELWRERSFENPFSISVNPINGTCWLAYGKSRNVVQLVIMK